MAEMSLWVTNPPIHTDMRASSFAPYTNHNNGLQSGGWYTTYRVPNN
jgi:hypothetical protein